MLTADLENPAAYGRIVRQNNHELHSIVEQRDATPEILKIREVNSGIYIFKAVSLFESLARIRQ